MTLVHATSSRKKTRAEQHQTREVVRLINRQRRLHGRRALKHDRELQAAASWRARDMARYGYLDHHQHNGAEWWEVVEGYDDTYPHLGENIARGFDNPRDLVSAWMRSPLHRKNILDRKFTHAGMASVGGFWAHEFGG